MGSATSCGLPLGEDEIQRIGDYINPRIRRLIGTVVPKPAAAGIDLQLLERMVSVEKELKAQREFMDDRFRVQAL